MGSVKSTWKGLKEWERAETEYANETIQLTMNEVQKTALRIERDAKLLSPVDTGLLRMSITTDLKRGSKSFSAEIGSDVEYADVVEFGAFNQRAQPYLIPSFDRNIEDLEDAINEVLKGR